MVNYHLPYELVEDRFGQYRAFLPGAMPVPHELHANTMRAAAQATHRLASCFGELPAVVQRQLAAIEALASSAIEGIIVSAADLLAPPGSTGVHAYDVPRAQAAIIQAIDGPATTPITLHETLGGGDAPDLVGQWRQIPVWIGGRNPQSAHFVPPAARHLPRLMQELEDWRQVTGLSGLSLAAMHHARFESIHPFPDGNGRVGRALSQQTLAQEGVLGSAAPLSVHLLRSRPHYYETLDLHREGDDSYGIHLFAEAADHACRIARDLRKFHRDELEFRSTTFTGSARTLALKLLERPVGGCRQLGEGFSKATFYRACEVLVESSMASWGPTHQKSRMLVDWETIDCLDSLAGLRQRTRKFAADRRL